MKRKKLALTLVLALLCSAMAGVNLTNLAEANPSHKQIGVVPPDAETKSPTITIISPHNGTTYDVDNVNFICDVSVGESKTAYKTDIAEVYYEADWLPNKTYTLEYRPSDPFKLGNKHDFPPTFTFDLNLTGIPDGKHSITVYARELGHYLIDANLLWYHSFYIDISSSISFTIETGPPLIIVFSLENKTYDTYSIPLNFTVNESVSQVKYSLDGQENVTITGNTTLTGLPSGDHSVTVYAIDEAGNVGVSEPICFSVFPFPTTIVAASTGTLTVIVGLLVYYKKHKR